MGRWTTLDVGRIRLRATLDVDDVPTSTRVHIRLRTHGIPNRAWEDTQAAMGSVDVKWADVTRWADMGTRTRTREPGRSARVE